MTTDRWFAFRAYNSQTLFGYGTEEEADLYADFLNTSRTYNVYGAYPVSADEDDAENLERNTDAFNLADELQSIAEENMA